MKHPADDGADFYVGNFSSWFSFCQIQLRIFAADEFYDSN